MRITEATVLFEASKEKCFAFWFSESGTLQMERRIQDHEDVLHGDSYRIEHTVYCGDEAKSFSCHGCIGRVILTPGQIEIELTCEGQNRLAIENEKLTVEFTDLPNQDFAALRNVLKAVFSDTDIFVCITPQDEELAAFKAAVLDRYQSLGLTLSNNRAAVMWAMSEHFPASKMRTVYNMISQHEHPP